MQVTFCSTSEIRPAARMLKTYIAIRSTSDAARPAAQSDVAAGHLQKLRPHEVLQECEIRGNLTPGGLLFTSDDYQSLYTSGSERRVRETEFNIGVFVT